MTSPTYSTGKTPRAKHNNTMIIWCASGRSKERAHS
jgi:hypothetical protein